MKKKDPFDGPSIPPPNQIKHFEAKKVNKVYEFLKSHIRSLRQ